MASRMFTGAESFVFVSELLRYGTRKAALDYMVAKAEGDRAWSTGAPDHEFNRAKNALEAAEQNRKVVSDLGVEAHSALVIAGSPDGFSVKGYLARCSPQQVEAFNAVALSYVEYSRVMHEAAGEWVTVNPPVKVANEAPPADAV